MILEDQLGVTEPTISEYIDIANGTFIWRSMPSFEHNVTNVLSKCPVDISVIQGYYIICAYWKLENNYKSSIIAGFSFEAFVVEEILNGLQDIRVQVQAYYYRTHSGAEIDLVLEGNFGILPIEIKHGSTVLARQLRAMTEFIQGIVYPLAF